MRLSKDDSLLKLVVSQSNFYAFGVLVSPMLSGVGYLSKKNFGAKRKFFGGRKFF